MSAVSTLTLYSVYLLPCPSWFHTMTMLDGVSVGRGQKGEEFLRDLVLLDAVHTAAEKTVMT